jgi:single-stranded DNA-binding protein
MPAQEYEDQNWVGLSGVIADTPRFITVEHQASVRFKLEVHTRRPGLSHIETLLVNISVYGEPAERGYPFLKRGSRIAVFGKVDVRTYTDLPSGRPRFVQEVVALELLPSFGADWERGGLHLENLGLQHDPRCAILSHSEPTRK